MGQGASAGGRKRLEIEEKREKLTPSNLVMPPMRHDSPAMLRVTVVDCPQSDDVEGYSWQNNIRKRFIATGPEYPPASHDALSKSTSPQSSLSCHPPGRGDKAILPRALPPGCRVGLLRVARHTSTPGGYNPGASGNPSRTDYWLKATQRGFYPLRRPSL